MCSVIAVRLAGMIGERIRERLDELEWKPVRLAGALGVSETTVARWVSGLNEPRASQLLAIADALDVSPASLLGVPEARLIEPTDDPSPILTEEDVVDVMRRVACGPLPHPDKVAMALAYLRKHEVPEAESWMREAFQEFAYRAWKFKSEANATLSEQDASAGPEIPVGPTNPVRRAARARVEKSDAQPRAPRARGSGTK